MGERYRGLRRIAGALALGASTWCTAAQAQVTFDNCKVDNEVAADQRTAYQKAALDFAALLVKQDAAQIHLRFTPDLRSGITLEQISSGILQQIVPVIEGLGALRVSQSYLVTSRGIGANHTVMCGSIAGDKVFLATKSGEKQAHVIVDAASRNYTVMFVLWLVEASDDWLIQGLDVEWTSLVGKTAADLRAKAQAQRQRGHAFTAAMLYAGASKLAFRGKYMQLSLWQDIQREAKGLELPEELKGDPPFTWRIGSDTFRILWVSPAGVDGKFALTVRREVPSLADTSSVDGESRHLIAGFTNSHPEIREVFDTMVVQAAEARSGKVFATAEEFR